MRAPLAFLLGKLHFDKEFRNIQGQPDAGGTRIIAEPKTDSLPYTKVVFLVGPDGQIRNAAGNRLRPIHPGVRIRPGEAESAARS